MTSACYWRKKMQVMLEEVPKWPHLMCEAMSIARHYKPNNKP